VALSTPISLIEAEAGAATTSAMSAASAGRNRLTEGIEHENGATVAALAARLQEAGMPAAYLWR
jgi:hypothetical protein